MISKFTRLTLSVLLLTSFSLYGESLFKKVNIAIKGGIKYQNGGDVNRLANFFNQYFSGYRKYGSVEGEIKELHYGMATEVDLIFNLNKRTGVGFGTGYLKAENRSLIKAYHGLGTGDYSTGDFNPSISVIPLKLSGYFKFPLLSELHFYLKGGIGYYFANLDFWRKTEYFAGRYPSGGARRDEAKDGNFGFHFGIGLSFPILKSIDFILEGEGKILKFDNLKSKHTWENWLEDSYYRYEVEGLLKYVDLKPYGLPWEDLWPDFYAKLFNGRRAELDLSGFSLKAGIKLSF